MRHHLATSCLLALALALVSGAVQAAGPLEALREAERASRVKLSRLQATQLERRAELSVLSERIEVLKGSARGRLLRGGALDAALKRSQELSMALTGIAQAVSARQAELEAASLALLDGLSQEAVRVRQAFDATTGRAERRQLLGRLRALREETEGVRAGLPATKVPTLGPLAPTDDPVELLEQADLLRDHEEKVAKELKTLDARIAERRQEDELDRRVERFLDEESLFDEQDRRLRVERTATFAAGEQGPGASGGAPGGESPPVSADSAPGSQYDTSLAADRPNVETAGPGRDGSEMRVATSGSDARPQVGALQSAALDDADVGRLEQERARLQALRRDLLQRALDLEARAGRAR